MLLQKDIHKTKHYFQKKLQNLMSFIFRRYQKLPKTSPKNPFSKDKSHPRKKQLTDLYRDLSEQWESDRDEAMKIKTSIKTMNENAASERFTDYTAQIVKKSPKEKRENGESKRGSYRAGDVSRRGGHELEQKMKELEMMMNVNDIDHVMDIEEALYLYSRLTCPVYLELLDKFFMDMYAEFFLPKPSLSINNSMRRLGPVKL